MRSLDLIKSAFPFPALATPFISAVDAPLSIPKLKHLQTFMIKLIDTIESRSGSRILFAEGSSVVGASPPKTSIEPKISRGTNSAQAGG